MSDAPSIDLASLRAWIGRTDTAFDTVSPRLLAELNVTLDNDSGTAEGGEGVPLAIHWCLAPYAARTSLLGADGHPARGGFLPPVPLPRRMWASGAVEFKDYLRAGDPVERRSSITDVTVKEGRSGTLCFVTVSHEIITPRGTALLERQDIVYSGIAKPADAVTPATRPEAQWRHESKASPVLLFRYSALTFNGHRIHYDRTYATEVEHYPGLVVHGPLQATLLIEFAAHIKNKPPCGFKFRGVKPLYDFMPFHLCAREIENGLHLWIETGDGIQTMDMEASW